MATTQHIAQKASVIGSQTISTKIYNYGYYPLLKGDFAPIVQFNKDASISVQHYLDLQQPLVLAFYTGFNTNINSFDSLISLHKQVQKNGGNLVIIANNTSRNFRKRLNDITNLNVFIDTENEVAEQFGLFDASNPLNNWVSGVDDENATLPAIYLIAPDRQITFHYVDYNFNLFSGENLAKSLLEQLTDAVSTLSTSYTYLSVWRNKLVS